MSSARRLIVTVRWGPLAAHKAIVAPGGALRVGRTERADLMVPHDPEMSGLHCEIAWDGAACRVRDLGSARGTLLDGAPIDREAEVRHGSWIRAGETVLSVYVEASTPSRSEEPPNPALTAAAARARETLAPRLGRLYAVLDAARDERILELLRESVDQSKSLYDGVKGEALADAAPYLVALEPGSGLLDRLLDEGWGRSWGVFAVSERPFKAVRRHLRRFLLVEDDETGGRMYFRFYDPRVLRDFMPIATPRQRDDLFGEIDAFFAEGEGGELLRFDHER